MNTSVESTLDTTLAGQSDHFKQKVLDVVRRSGINPKDPLFLVLSSLGKFEVLMEDIPGKLNTVVEGWTTEIDDKLDKASSVAIVQQKSAIAKAISTLLSKAEQKKSRSVFNPLIATGLVLSGLFGIVMLTGNIFFLWRGRGLTEPVRLTVEEQEILNWAKSKDGEFARQIMKWNDFDLSVCRAKKAQLKGRCMVWVVNNEERQRYLDQLNQKSKSSR
ncbi:hypothetical protein PN497_19265 [Sphaerospermopsis kisseleviana CS-549]|jgi:hypothetical protein|uniref:Uncharacterized protein n=2 Tax=Sphaerospermopsis TaxID=752201 RepID=A0A480A0V6_9CYAN|nr:MULTISPECIES: DUF6753 family protein [Sphaerospermopsis]MBD2131016.1 hypothetical protein [Sphaerospermopsis sp. FACHB-1094]MDB9443483.1 hypothetical protein [Sphaerospermopsis kisseleviana CS-549]BAZ83803.1 hypothetical protein NIES73_50920 [Sphaerospermopsis kisseleviana NIES-73]GCL35744.1 hypothetical protein SR1949_08420 [Sphaerospermopsis reniformis]